MLMNWEGKQILSTNQDVRPHLGPFQNTGEVRRGPIFPRAGNRASLVLKYSKYFKDIPDFVANLVNM